MNIFFQIGNSFSHFRRCGSSSVLFKMRNEIIFALALLLPLLGSVSANEQEMQLASNCRYRRE